MDLLDTWRKWRPGSPPFILDADREFFEQQGSDKAFVTYTSWEDAISASDFCVREDSRLHLGLLPQPFLGDVRNARVYILLLNPGIGPHDYYAEYEVPSFRAAVLANLQQHFSDGASRFLFLDPRYAWHGGFTWWHGKFAKLMERVADSQQISFSEARAYLASVIASIELFPYHSKTFNAPARWLSALHSVKLARDFVSEYVLPRAKRGDAIVIVTRKAAEWGNLKGRGVITYGAHQARAAHLTPDTPGGRAILKFLRRN